MHRFGLGTPFYAFNKVETVTKSVRVALVTLIGGLVVAQVVPIPPAENPTVGQEVPADAEVRQILQTSCYDCHSNETIWPWYSHVIPSKWFVRKHVVEGREHLNFSTWGQYTPERAAHKMEEVVEMIEEGEMPLPSYLRLHGEAELSPAQQQVLLIWARELGGEGG